MAKIRKEQLTTTSGPGVLQADGSGNISESTALADGTTATTQTDGDDSTKLATTAYVDNHGGNDIWTRTGTSIGVTNAGDDVDLSTAAIMIESVATLVSVVAANGITAITDTNIPIESSTAGDSTVTANPAIVAGVNGQSLRLIGTDDTKTVTFTDGNGIALDNAQPFTLGENDIIEFIYYNSLWLETSRKDN